MTVLTDQAGGGPVPAYSPSPELSRRRRRVRLLRRVVLLILAIFLAYSVATFFQVWHAAGQDDASRSGAIIVLGAAQYDGRPSPVLEARLEHAFDLYERDVAPVIVVTGGRRDGDRYTEATAGYNWLREAGVPDGAIRKEVQGRSTWESLAAVARFLRSEDIERVVLVSDPYHAFRLRGVAEEVGLDAVVSPAGGQLQGTGSQIRRLLRETAAVSIGRILGYRRLSNLETAE